MPHPRFRHQWEEDSYWRHYENYLEAEGYQKEQEQQEAAVAAAAAEEKRRKALVSRQMTVNGDDGWVTVVSRKNKKIT